MGRPRKRRHVDESQEPLTQEMSTSSHKTSIPQPATTFQQNAYPYLQTLQPSHADSYNAQDQSGFQPPLYTDPLDTSLSFLDDSATPNLEFWDLLPTNYLNPIPTAALAEPQISLQDESGPDRPHSTYRMPLGGMDLIGTINFDEPAPSQEAVSKDITESLQQYLSHHQALRQTDKKAPTSPDSTFCSDHDTSIGSLKDGAATPPPVAMRPVPNVNCGCLSSLYLAIDSLSRLPGQVGPAMRVARNAIKVAHDAVQCPICLGSTEDELHVVPPIQSFQNLMLLATLIPSACNAYATILEMVDAETAAAKKEDRTFWFTFKELGGLWGYLFNSENRCSVMDNYNNSTMAPDLWRATIRALLRLDVYGIEGLDHMPKKNTYIQLGLKDVVKRLEERSNKRHDAIEKFVASGQVSKTMHTGVLYPKEQPPPEDRACLKILATARIALENLVIA